MKKTLSVIMAVVIFMCAVPMSDCHQLDFSRIKASAADDSQPLSWVKNDDNTITITACDTSYSGTLIVPQTIEGMPVSGIRESALDNCSLLTELVIPETVVSIGTNICQKCLSLQKITVDQSNNSFSSDEYGILYNKDKSILYCCPPSNGITEFTVPDTVTKISFRAFYECSNLESVVLNDKITEISSTFYGCSSLKSVTLPEGLKKIDAFAFYKCTGLININIPDEVTLIGMHAFDGCKGLREISIPDSVTEMGHHAFSYCTDLKSVKLSKNLSAIDEDAFRNDPNLTSIDIPPSVASIGSSAFYSCTNLRNVILHGETDIVQSAFRAPGSGLMNNLTIIIDGDAPQTKELVKQYGINCVDVDYDHGEKVISFNGKTTVYAGADYSYITNCIMEQPEAEYLYFDKLIFDGVKNDVIISDEMDFIEPDAENLTFNHLYVNMKMITEDGDKNITFEKMLEEFEKGNYDAFKLVVKSDEGEHEQNVFIKFIEKVLTDALNAMSRAINFFARIFKRK